MQMLIEIMKSILENEEIQIVFPNLKLNASELLECKCFNAIKEIKAIIENESLSDKDCFMKIEEIICVFEKLGCNCGNRHDY